MCQLDILVRDHNRYLMTQKDKTNIKRFRMRTKKLFLTYPQVPNVADIEEQFVRVLKDKFKNTFMKYFICKEEHKDGNPHIHAYLEFSCTQEIPSREKLHVEIIESDGKIKLCEGKYEAVRNSGKTLEYITKDCDEGDYRTNMYVPVIDGKFY